MFELKKKQKKIDNFSWWDATNCLRRIRGIEEEITRCNKKIITSPIEGTLDFESVDERITSLEYQKASFQVKYMEYVDSLRVKVVYRQNENKSNSQSQF